MHVLEIFKKLLIRARCFDLFVPPFVYSRRAFILMVFLWLPWFVFFIEAEAVAENMIMMMIIQMIFETPTFRQLDTY